MKSSRDLDVAIIGSGYFQVLASHTGGSFYTRTARLSLDANGTLMVGHPYNACQLDPPITIPMDWDRVHILPTGEVNGFRGSRSPETTVGCIQIAKFANETGLKEAYPNVYLATPASGIAELDEPGRNGLGLLHQGWAEESDVDNVIYKSRVLLVLIAGIGGIWFAERKYFQRAM